MGNEENACEGVEVNETLEAASLSVRVATWIERLLALPLLLRTALALLLLGVVASLNAFAGAEMSFSIFYLVPVVYAGILISAGPGRIFAVVSAAVWGYLDVTNGMPYSVWWIPLWNASVRFVFFLLINELVVALWNVYQHERMLSRTDGLTGLANARVFKEHVERTIGLSMRNGLPFTIAYIDLDHFKQINDRSGHTEGDRLLKVAASIVGGDLRATDTAARLGGDEFALLLPDTGAAQARILLERIMEKVAREVTSRWLVSMTIGAATYIEAPDNVDCAIRLADTLMYRGKEQGRGCLVQATWPDFCD